MAERQIVYRASINTAYDAQTRVAIGNEIISKIVSKAKAGRGVSGALPKYSKSYRESKEFKVAGKGSVTNLTFTGQMLLSLEVLEHGSGFVVVGFPDRGVSHGNNDKAAWVTDKGFDFMGLTPSELAGILAQFPLDISVVDNGILNSFIRSILGN